MRAGIAQSRWALRVHCVRGVWKILSQKMVESLEESTVTASESLSLTVEGLWQNGEERCDRIDGKKERERQALLS